MAIVLLDNSTSPVIEKNVAGTGHFPVFRIATGDTTTLTAAALADNTANPTTLSFGAMLEAWDGSNWQRPRNVFSDSDGRVAMNALCVNSLGYVMNAAGPWDRQRSAPAAAATNGTGLAGAGLLADDNTGTYRACYMANGDTQTA